MTIVYFIVVLGILIFVHELGHFLAAKGLGVRVLKFSLGFGPKVIGKKIGDTDYMISALPLGGYVKMMGDNLEEEIPEDEKPYSFLSQKNWKKIIIVGAGPFFNLIFAAIVLWMVFMIGVPVPDAVVGELKEGYPAIEAGMMTGDRIISIDGEEVSDWTEMAAIIMGSEGRELEIVAMREDEELLFSVTPILGEGLSEVLTPKQQYMIGITQSGIYHTVKRGPISALFEGIKRTADYTRLTFIIIGKMFTGEVALDNLGGPILIAQIAGSAARQGLVSFLGFLALISINLAILNLLPVPVLDGGHLLFFVIEAAIRRPISVKVKEVALQIGLALLVVLMIMAFYFDISRLINLG
jgi:regulator of sigma E protease